MKNKILLTVAIALIGLLGFSTSAEATPRHRGHQHVFFERGNRVVVWHNNYSQCGNRFGYGNFNGVRTRMCMHMNNIWNGGRFGRAAIRCNHRGCNMFGMSFRNGRFFNGPRGNGFHRGGRGNGRFNQGGGRGNGRFNQGGGRGNGRFNQGGGRGNGRFNQGGGRGNGRFNQGGGRGNGKGQGGGKGRGNGRGNGGRNGGR